LTRPTSTPSIIRDADAFEDELGGVDALVAHLVDLAGDGEAGDGRVRAVAGLLLDQEGGHVPVRGVVPVVGVAQHRDQVGGAAVRQPHLLAVDDEILAIGHRARADGGDVGAEAGLGHGEGAAHVAGRHPGQEVGLLLLRAVPGDHVGHDEVGVDDAGHRHPAPRDLLHGQRVDQQRGAEAAVFGGDGQAEQAELLQSLHDLDRVLVPVLELGGHREDLPFGEVVHRGQDVPLELVQSVGLRQASHGSLPFVLQASGSGRPGWAPPRSLTYSSVGIMTLRRNTQTTVPSCL
jgi:hypothetical protein